jgi:hypothetical protein
MARSECASSSRTLGHRIVWSGVVVVVRLCPTSMGAYLAAYSLAQCITARANMQCFGREDVLERNK